MVALFHEAAAAERAGGVDIGERPAAASDGGEVGAERARDAPAAQGHVHERVGGLLDVGVGDVDAARAQQRAVHDVELLAARDRSQHADAPRPERDDPQVDLALAGVRARLAGHDQAAAVVVEPGDVDVAPHRLAADPAAGERARPHVAAVAPQPRDHAAAQHRVGDRPADAAHVRAATTAHVDAAEGAAPRPRSVLRCTAIAADDPTSATGTSAAAPASDGGAASARTTSARGRGTARLPPKEGATWLVP